jgi:hypothetical protein
MRPHVLLTADEIPGLRSVEAVRRATADGHSHSLYLRLQQAADADLNTAPLLPSTPLEGRDPDLTRHANPDYVIVQAVAERLQSAALMALLSQKPAYRDAALIQLETLFDPALWPEWRDQAHTQVEADLRTGQLCQAIGLSYDWLHTLLRPEQRAWILAGLERCGLRRYFAAVEADAWWLTRQNNWMACVVGGLGVCGMGLGSDYSQTDRLLDLSLGRMQRYLEVYGPAGEFNENVAYAGATRLPVTYFAAHRYHTGGGDNHLARHPFPQTCRWYMHFAAPPGRLAAFGDSHPEAAPHTDHLAAVAAAAGDKLLQWFYLNMPGNPLACSPALELLYFDDTVPPQSPKENLSLGQAYPAHHGCITSRATWDKKSTPSLVFAKAGHGSEGHGHHDAGQLTLDGLGQRLIVDLGSPSMYPADFFGENRYRYYNASVRGHNVLVFDGEESAVGNNRRAEITHSDFSPQGGGTWSLDLSGCYDGVTGVKRHVIHLTPWVVAVLDEARLPNNRHISLRWHTADRAAPAADGSFGVEKDGARLAAQIVSLNGPGTANFQRGQHRFIPPFDQGRSGDPLTQRHESYVEAELEASNCRLLSLFAVLPPDAAPTQWREQDGVWTLDLPGHTPQVAYTAAALELSDAVTGHVWKVALD